MERRDSKPDKSYERVVAAQFHGAKTKPMLLKMSFDSIR
jgi:hypothetical protein